jgi:phage gp29-like protein
MLFKFFKKKTRHASHESAHQLTAYERRALEIPGVPPGPLGYAVYDAMERDSMIQTALTIKKLAVASAETRVVAANSSGEARRRAEFVETVFERMEGSPLTILQQAIDAFAKGWAVQEMVFEVIGGRVWLRAVRSKNPLNFGVHLDAFGNPLGLNLQLPGESARELPRWKFVLYANRSGYGRPKGKSDLDAAHPHWKAKQSLLNAWRIHLERFASPTVVGRYQRGLSADEQGQILGALSNLQNNTAIVCPNEIEIDTLGGKPEPSTGFMDALDFHNREMARAILGQTLTTDEGRRVGSLALGKVHLQVMLLQINAIRRELADLVMTEQVIRPLVEMNFGPGLIPKFEFVQSVPEAFLTGRLD